MVRFARLLDINRDFESQYFALIADAWPIVVGIHEGARMESSPITMFIELYVNGDTWRWKDVIDCVNCSMGTRLVRGWFWLGWWWWDDEMYMVKINWDDFWEAIFAFVTYVVLHIWEWGEVFNLWENVWGKVTWKIYPIKMEIILSMIKEMIMI
jgi:hypothetical protein